MNDKMTPDKERENCPCRKAIINPFDAMMMVVVSVMFSAMQRTKKKPSVNFSLRVSTATLRPQETSLFL